MTKLLEDILNEPGELKNSLAYTAGPGRDVLKHAADVVADAQNIYITGIGSSWHAALAIGSIFEHEGIPVHVLDASELLHMVRIPQQSCVVVLSRSGKSAEVAGLIENAQEAGASIVAITNAVDSRLATRAEVVLQLAAAYDHNISITMYSALTLVGGLLAAAVTDKLDDRLTQDLHKALEATEKRLSGWRRQLESSAWFERDMTTYFLGRGGSLACANETRLLWEEAAKAPACAISTGGFRHGPQEILHKRLRIMFWLHPQRMRQQDLSLVSDLRRHGVHVALIGNKLPDDAAELMFEVPPTPESWHFLTDIIPGQLAAERFAMLRGVDCDTFQYCPYIIDTEGGLSYPTPSKRA